MCICLKVNGEMPIKFLKRLINYERTDLMRIDKLLANVGFGSRKELKKY